MFFSKLLRQGKEALLSLYREENVVCPNRKRCFDDRVSWDFSKNFLKNLRVYVTVTIVIFALVQENSVHYILFFKRFLGIRRFV